MQGPALAAQQSLRVSSRDAIEKERRRQQRKQHGHDPWHDGAYDLFARLLLPLLDYGREREGIDLSALRLTHHKLRDLGQQKLNLAGGEPAEGLKPVTEVGSGEIQDRQKQLLA
ncbi:MAG: hypothetical protein B7Z42_16595, partial [Brevundimonas sp. 12-68-7]